MTTIFNISLHADVGAFALIILSHSLFIMLMINFF